MIKDPLRYFVDENFGAIFSFRREDGEYIGCIRMHGLNEHFVPVSVSFRGLPAIRFPKYNLYYVIDSFLFKKYGTLYNSKEEVDAAIEKYDVECSETIEFMETVKDLIP